MLFGGGSWVGPIGKPLSGTTTAMNATTGQNGQLFFNTTYNALFQYATNRWWPVGHPDPRYGLFVHDEFLSATSPSQLDWLGIGTINIQSSSNALHPGVALIDQSTAASNSGLVMEYLQNKISTADVYLEAIVAIPTLATIAEDFTCSIGLQGGVAYDANGAAADGVWISYNRASNGALWNCVTSAASVATTTKSSSAIVAATYYRVGFLISGGTSVNFYVNGVLIGTNSTNIPTTAGVGIVLRVDKKAGTALSELQVDHINMYWFFNQARVA